MRKLILALILLAVVYGAWFHETRWPVRRASDPPQPLVIAPGAGVLDIGRLLEQLGLVRHPEVFRLLVLSRGETGRLRAGEYELTGTMSVDQIIDKLVRGDVVRHVVTFPEGTNLEDMARLVAVKGVPQAAFLAAAHDPAPIHDLDPEAKDLEGYLFPDTYDVPRGPDAAAHLVARMVRRFRDVITPELPALEQGGRSLRQVVTLASIVELETARPEERPRVAAVFLNRLHKKMPLQTDPTVIYALRRAGTYDGNIHKDDLEVDSPYNTYRFPGLPPGPIASPGRASLQAALHPDTSRDLYFVSRNDGSHQFSETLAEHERWVNLFQRHRGAVAMASPGAPPAPGAAPSPGPLRSPGTAAQGVPGPAASPAAPRASARPPS
ncbi:MAG: endolytic transglycosylase MltG [Acidobacteria bacterium]|nr:MAG: endolytic transglycosylase MltG [Acidobacteriota bacterium]